MGDDGLKAIMEARKITKTFIKEGVKSTVLRDFSIAVDENQFLTILGASGCGKTTALNILGGFERPEAGEVFLKGLPLAAPSFSAVMVFQDSHQLFPWLRLKDNVAMPVKKRYPKESPPFYAERVREILEQVELEGYEEYYPHELSGGMRQRGAIARALASNPDILLMDEPFASVDAITRETLQDLLLKIWRKTPMTVVFVTHDIEEALYLSDKIMVMKKEPGGSFQSLPNPWKGIRKTGEAYFDEKERIKNEITA